MKKTIITAIAGILIFSLSSCNDHNSDYDQITEVNRVAIDSVKLVNDTMQVFAVQSIITYSDYTSGCEGFYAYDYQRDDFDRYVSTYKFKTDGSCGNSGAHPTKIDFQPRETGNYVFKFWQGKDADSNDIWLEKTVVVE